MNRKQITAIIGIVALTSLGILSAKPALGRSVSSQERIAREMPDNLLAGRHRRRTIYPQPTCRDARANEDAAIAATSLGLNCGPSTNLHLEDNLRNWNNSVEAMSCTPNVGKWNPDLNICMPRPNFECQQPGTIWLPGDKECVPSRSQQ